MSQSTTLAVRRRGFTVHHCSVVTASTTGFRPDLNQTRQLRTVARLRMQQRKNIALQAHGHNTLHEGKQAGSIQSYETATKWSNLALITEASRYHRDLSAKTGEYRTFLPTGGPGVYTPLYFGSSLMLKLLLKDTHLMYSHAQAQQEAAAAMINNRCNPDSPQRYQNRSSSSSPSSSASCTQDSFLYNADKVKAVETADAMCRQQLGLLHLWRDAAPLTQV